MHNRALFDHHHPIGHRHRKAQHLLRHHNADLPHLLDLVQVLSELLDDRRLDTLRGLIQQQHLRVGRQRPANGQLLLLPPGQVARLPVAHVVQHREQVVDIGWDLLRPGRLQTGGDVLLHRQGRKHQPALGHIGDALLHPLVGLGRRQILVAQGDPALGRQHPDQRLEQRRLAHAVAPHDGERLVLTHIQGHPVDHFTHAVADT